MPAEFNASRGTSDVLPAEAISRAALESAAADLLGRSGFGRIETPAFEQTELFVRGVGEATEIVSKEMFTFEDQGGRSLTLRPEGTAPICRAYVEHGMHKLAQPVQLWYCGPFFRHERPQAGRFRQFTQIGIETIGTDDPAADVQAIWLLHELVTALGVPGVALRLGSLGSQESRAAYRRELTDYLDQHQAELPSEVRERVALNPLRAFDSSDEATQAVIAEAPRLLDRLDPEDEKHFATVQRLLTEAGISFELDGTLVRGLDYYTRTVFEFTSDQLGAQSAIGGGGRYDGLIEQLGGPKTPAIGWAAGVERILLALGDEAAEPPPQVFVAAEEDEHERALTLAMQMWNQGLSAQLDLAGRSMKGQMKHADRLNAKRTVVLKSDGTVQVRDMTTGEQHETDLDRVIEEVSR